MTSKRTRQQIEAATRKRERMERHAALMARHAAHRAANEAVDNANNNLNKLGLGPRVLRPDEVIGGVVPTDDDLLRAAEELGIDLSGVGA